MFTHRRNLSHCSCAAKVTRVLWIFLVTSILSLENYRKTLILITHQSHWWMSTWDVFLDCNITLSELNGKSFKPTYLQYIEILLITRKCKDTRGLSKRPGTIGNIKLRSIHFYISTSRNLVSNHQERNSDHHISPGACFLNLHPHWRIKII